MRIIYGVEWESTTIKKNQVMFILHMKWLTRKGQLVKGFNFDYIGRHNKVRNNEKGNQREYLRSIISFCYDEESLKVI